MLSFHNDNSVKELYLNRVKAHHDADEIVKGIYWQDGKGCAVGCTIHGNDHLAYEKELGIPIILAKLEDGIFENLPTKRAKIWPLEFLQSIKVGADLSNVWPNFSIWLLTDKKYGVLQYAKTKKIKNYIKEVAEGYKNYKTMTKEDWINIKRASYAAAYAAADADADADAYAADAAAYAAAYAAYAAADAAAYAAYAADAAYAAADAAAYADAADAYAADAYAAAAVKQKHRIAQADKLLELLRECV